MLSIGSIWTATRKTHVLPLSSRWLRLPGVDDVAGLSAGRKQDHVHANIFALCGILVRHAFHGCGHARQPALVYRQIEVRQRCAAI